MLLETNNLKGLLIKSVRGADMNLATKPYTSELERDPATKYFYIQFIFDTRFLS